jgi:tetratricopeptide (TPR) repeat protein
MNTPITDLRICRSLLLMLLACCTIADYSAQAFVRQDEAASEEESVQIKTAERFLSVLEKNPRYGTALDRVYGHHVEFGSLDKFLNSLNERAQKQTDNGALWMMLGMFESQRGGDAAAVEALTQAEKLRVQDGLASFYLGQAQLRIGQSEEAIQSFE